MRRAEDFLLRGALASRRKLGRPEAVSPRNRNACASGVGR